LTLAGGYGYLTGQYGLALDNLVQATIITADGRTRTVSQTENNDLFWAIRGGGGNFGVVTEFVLQLHPQRRTIFGGIAVFHPDALPKIVDTLTTWWNRGFSEKETIVHGVTVAPDGNPCTVLILFWNGSEEEGRLHFKPFFDIGPIKDGCCEMPYEELNGIQNAGLIHGNNYFMKGIFTSGPQQGVPQELLARIRHLSAKHDLGLVTFFEYLPTRKVLSVPNSATAHIRGSRVSTLVVCTWAHSATDRLPTVRKAVNELVEIIRSSEKRLPADTNTGYGNYIADEPAPGPNRAQESGSRVGADVLFGENYPRLQQLKKEYDPMMIFARWCPISPAA
ncbi:hypothetical protein BV25DRAFT_1795862, partial [Artomyces pyxidatus]